jgi:hypothetical protein
VCLMPAATTHVEFARDFLRIHPEIAETIRNHHMFWLGAQGPDLLFFSRASILPGSLHKYGNLMHEKKVWEVMDFFDRYSRGDQDLRDYLKGYLCHYALDSRVHPLVYGCAHYEHETKGTNEGAAHIRMEAEIDVWLLHQRGRHRESYNVYKYLKIDQERRRKLAAMYAGMFEEVYHLEIPVKRIEHAITEVSVWTGFIRPRKLTKNLIFGMENLVGMPHALSNMMLNGAKPGIILNLEHKTYGMPWNEKQTISRSFPELYGQALFYAEDLMKHHEKKDITLNFMGEPLENESADV